MSSKKADEIINKILGITNKILKEDVNINILEKYYYGAAESTGEKNNDNEHHNLSIDKDIESLTYEQKVEKILRENPSLLKDALRITKIKSIKKHTEDCLNKLNVLKISSIENPVELNKIKEINRELKEQIIKLRSEIEGLRKFHSDNN